MIKICSRNHNKCQITTNNNNLKLILTFLHILLIVDKTLTDLGFGLDKIYMNVNMDINVMPVLGF